MKFSINSIISLVIITILASCATMVRPDGGPRDTTPPIAKSFKPENGAMNMHQEKIVIKFDEYIVLKKLTQQLVVSPPMIENPKISVRGKSLIIELPDSLRENTTYTIFFGDAVVNYKENIPVKNFAYYFSTGSIVDSLQLSGFAVNAFDNSAYEELFVMLYKSMDDSVLYKNKPYYLTKTEKNGDFFIDNLAPGNYQIYAIKDANRNYIYDQEDEEIAFLDTLISPYHKSIFEPDTNAEGKKIEKDIPEKVGLFVFHPIPREIKLLDYRELPPNKVIFKFNRGVKDFKIIPMGFKSDTIWHTEVYGKNRDSVTVFFMGLNMDTINVRITDGEHNLDTLELVLKKKKKKRFISAREQKKLDKAKLEREKDPNYKPPPKVVTKIGFKTNIRSSFPFFGEIQFKFRIPLNKFNKDRIHIYKMVDTLLIPIKVDAWISDTINNMKINIRAKFDERQKYKLIIADGCFYDIYNSTNDTIDKSFTTTEMREYGSFDLDVKYDGKHPLIIQLLNSKDAVLVENFIDSSQKIVYPYLKGAKYKVKAIVDENNNGKWDTGDFDDRIQPERVYFINKSIDIRANWDTEHVWTIED